MTESERSQLAKMARQYYMEELPLREIAERFNVSVATVSRSLSRARREGIVEISIRDAHPGFGSLESQIEATFGIRECSVIQSHPVISDIYLDMADVIGNVLCRVLESGAILGVSWGETLRAIGSDLRVSGLKGVSVIPVIGAMGTIETGIFPNSIAKSFADKLGGVSYLVNAPMILDSLQVRDSVTKDRNLSTVMKMWEKVDVAILSVSGLGPESSVARFGVFSAEELALLRSLGVVCLTNFSMLDVHGNLVSNDFSDRIINLNVERLKSMRNVIIVACGAEKTQATHAALLSGFVDILVVDEKTAISLVQLAGAKN